jgi:hypothetical protein
VHKRYGSNYSLWPEQARPRRAIPLTTAVGGFAIGIVCAVAAYNVVTDFLRPVSMQQVVRESAVAHVPINTTATARRPLPRSRLPIPWNLAVVPGPVDRSRKSRCRPLAPVRSRRAPTPTDVETPTAAVATCSATPPRHRLPLSRSRRSKIPSLQINHQRSQARGKRSMLRVSVYCSPVLRHPAGLIQAANFRSAIAL